METHNEHRKYNQYAKHERALLCRGDCRLPIAEKETNSSPYYYLRNRIHDSIIYNEEIYWVRVCVHNFSSFKCALFSLFSLLSMTITMMMTTTTTTTTMTAACFDTHKKKHIRFSDALHAYDDRMNRLALLLFSVCSWLRFVSHTRDNFGSLFTLYFNLCCMYMTGIQRDCKAVGIAISFRYFFYAWDRRIWLCMHMHKRSFSQ